MTTGKRGPGPGARPDGVEAPLTDVARARLGELADDYEISRELGRGGTAVVYHARERGLGREVAIKVVHPMHVEDAEATARLAREARLIAQLRHPNIVTLFSTRPLADGSIALIMQYVPGRTLKRAIREDGPLPVSTATTILREVALALHYAHQRHGIVHRDIKPENIYLDTEGGRTLLSDFGIARSSESESSLTVAGTALGTPAYMSPEQIDGLELDARSDLYSLGLVAYEMLTGQQPWSGHNLYTVIYKQKHEDLPSIADVRRDVPMYLQRAIEKLLQKDRDSRWIDGARFVAELSPGGAGRIAPPAIAPRFRGGATTPATDDDTPTVLYLPATARPQSVEPPRSAEPTSADEPPQFAEPHAHPPAQRESRDIDIQSDAPPPVLRFFMDGDEAAEPVPATDSAARTADGTPHPRRRRRREPLLIGTALFVVLAGAVVPMINAEVDRSTRSDDVTPSGMDVPIATGDSTAGVGRRIVAVTDNQTGYVGQTLPLPIGIIVEDQDGREVSGEAVEFVVTAGGGHVVGDRTISDERGLAMTQWTLGEEPGPNELIARLVDDTTVSTVFSANGIAGMPARLEVRAGNAQTALPGATLPDDVVVAAVDRSGHPVAGVRVDFSVLSGDGRVEPASAITDSTGVATARWTLGAQEANTLRASMGEGGPQIDFSARAVPRLAVQPGLFAGGTHTCSLAAAGLLRCWGANDNGQIGTGPSGIPAPSSWGFARIAAGVSHTCALDRDGLAFCWGFNGDAQLGSDDRSDRATPTRVRSPARFHTIAAGLTFSCALTEEGRAVCWGQGAGPQPVGGPAFADIAAGWRHACALTSEGAAYCWGTNNAGQVGTGSNDPAPAPVAVAGTLRFSSLAAGAAHTCGVTEGGAAFCWGENGSGQLGTGSPGNTARPLRVQFDEPFADIAAGAIHTCALTRAGAAYCWGRNSSGQLGNGETRDSHTPVPVAGGVRFTTLTARGSHTCGRTAAGEYFCWGYNAEGQLGDDSRTDRVTPVRVRIATR